METRFRGLLLVYQKFENKLLCVVFTVLRVSRELFSAKPVRKKKMCNGGDRSGGRQIKS